MFGFIKKILIGLWASVVSASSHTKCVFLSNQKCEIQPTIFKLHPNEYTQWLRYYPFAVNLYRFFRSFNTLNNLSNKVCVASKTEDLNLSVFNMITRINQSKTLTKHISCKCKFKFDGRKCNSNQKWNNDKCWCEGKNPNNHRVCEKDYMENGKYLTSIIDDSVIMCNEL